jgi:hypothetical protein
MQRNCENITEGIERISMKVGRLNFFDTKISLPIKSEIKDEMKEIFKVISPESAFVEALEDPDFKVKLMEFIRSSASACTELSDFMMRVMENLIFNYLDGFFANLKSAKPLSTQSYERFMTNLCDSPIVQNICEDAMTELNSIQKDGEVEKTYLYNAHPYHFYSILNSCFLEGMLKESQTLNLENTVIPDELFDYFCFGLSHGKIAAKYLGDSAGAALRGAELSAVRVGNFAGLAMDDGKIKVGQAGSYFAMDMGGGVATAKTCNVYAGSNAAEGIIFIENDSYGMLGHAASGGMFIANEGDDIGVESDAFGPIFVLGEEAKIDPTYAKRNPERHYHYRSHVSTGFVSEYHNGTLSTPQSIKTYDKLLTFFDMYPSFAMVSDPKIIYHPEFLTKMNDDCVLLTRFAPLENIGHGMTAGVLIIEDDDVILEEVRSRLTKEKHGGLILMRVPDEEKPGQTKLVDVEGEI